MKRRLAGLAYVGLGAALLALVLAGADAGQVAGLVLSVGWSLPAVVAVAALAFTADVASWLAVLPDWPFDLRHGLRLWGVRLVGEAFNNTLPLVGGVGGEPVKGAILVRGHGLDARAAIASLLVAKTVILLAYIPFLAIGLALMRAETALPASWLAVAGVGLAVYSAAILAFFLVQRYRVASLLGARVGRLGRLLHEIAAVDALLEHAYRRTPRRLGAALALAFLGWVLGAAELWVILRALGRPMGFLEVWVVEATAQLLRQGSFFIPGSLGVTEGTFYLLFQALTGQPSLGVAAALVRRLRELVWVGLGLAAGWRYLPKTARP
jgi:uncharacterized protein (TIRG00374 family)